MPVGILASWWAITPVVAGPCGVHSAALQPAMPSPWFAERGVELVEEADGRMFPASNRSSSVIEALRQAARRAGVQLLPKRACRWLGPWRRWFWLQARGDSSPVLVQRLLLATGGHPSGRRGGPGVGSSGGGSGALAVHLAGAGPLVERLGWLEPKPGGQSSPWGGAFPPAGHRAAHPLGAEWSRGVAAHGLCGTEAAAAALPG